MIAATSLRVSRRKLPFPILIALVGLALACGRSEQENEASALGRLAFVRGGDIWVRDLPGGVPRQLTTDGGNHRPRWSPSGEWLAYFHDQQLTVMNVTGAPASVLNAGAAVATFAWSPTSDTLAYALRAGGVRVTGPPAWSAKEIFEPGTAPAGVISGLEWNPQGKWIAFALQGVSEGDPGLPGERSSGGVWRVRSDGTGATEIYSGDPGASSATAASPSPAPADEGAILAGWTPDGRNILFWSYPSSASLLADGTSLKSIATGGGTPREIVRSMLPYPDFLAASPDGSDLLVARGAGRETWSHKRLVKVTLSTGDASALTPENEAAFAPAWDPGGERIAYVAAPDPGFQGAGAAAKAAAAQRRIWLVNRDGSDRRQLGGGSSYRDEEPLWSLDGGHILFARLDDKDQASLWLMRSDGTSIQQVVEKLSPAPGWFGYYGYIKWGEYFDWWRRPAPAEE
jgi:Tol biopolymer transport system component